MVINSVEGRCLIVSSSPILVQYSTATINIVIAGRIVTDSCIPIILMNLYNLTKHYQTESCFFVIRRKIAHEKECKQLRLKLRSLRVANLEDRAY